MTKKKKTDMPTDDKVFANGTSASDEIVPTEPVITEDVAGQIVSSTRGAVPPSMKTAAALAVLEDGAVPPNAIQTRPGYPKEIPYASHIWGTRTLNAALRWLWDYEVLEWEVFPDGSVATRCQLTIHIPQPTVQDRNNYYVRRITEIGSFEAYVKKDYKTKKPILDDFGEIQFTMNTADRVASSGSRGLMKAMLRAFDIGTELSEAEVELTNDDAWDLLLNFGRNQGLTREQIIDLMTANDVKGTELVDRYQECYTLIYNTAKGLVKESVPDLG